jgi:uncharacterized repeat protein (TIGR01451 family)
MLPRAATIFAASVGTGLALTGCGGGGPPNSRQLGHGPPRFLLDVAVRPAGGHVWRDSVTARPGEVIEHMVRVSNIGRGQAVGVRIRDELGRGESKVFASTRVQTLGVTMGISSGTAPGLFGHGATLAPPPGGGSTRIIRFQTRAGDRSFVEPVTLRWDGGQARSGARVSVRR